MKKFLLPLFLAFNVIFSLSAMEQTTSTSSERVDEIISELINDPNFTTFCTAVTIYQVTSNTIQKLENLVQLHAKVLSESDLNTEIKEELKDDSNRYNLIINTLKKNPFCISNLHELPASIDAIGYLIKTLKDDRFVEPLINKYLANYYTILGELTIIKCDCHIILGGSPKISSTINHGNLF